MQYLGWDSLFCKFCIPIRRIRNFDPCPAQGSWTTLAAEFVLGPKRRGKKLMNIFLGQDIGHLQIWRCEAINLLQNCFVHRKTSQPDPNSSTKMIFPQNHHHRIPVVPHPPIPVLLSSFLSKELLCIAWHVGPPAWMICHMSWLGDDVSWHLFWGVKDHGNADQKSGWKDESVTHKRTKGMRLFLGCGWDKMIGWGNNF